MDDVADAHRALDDADVRDHALVRVVVRVENQRLQRRRGVAFRRRDLVDDRLHDVADVLPGLRAHARRVLGRDADDVLDLLFDAVGVGAGQVDFIDDRHDLESRVDGEVRVRERLGFNPLARVDDEHGALARGERPADLVVKVDVAGCVDQVEYVIEAVFGRVDERDGVCLDRDAAFAL